MGFSRTPRWFGCFCSKFTNQIGIKVSTRLTGTVGTVCSIWLNPIKKFPGWLFFPNFYSPQKKASFIRPSPPNPDFGMSLLLKMNPLKRGYNSSYLFVTVFIGLINTPSETHFISSHSKKVPHFSKAPFGHGGLPRSAGGTRRFS